MGVLGNYVYSSFSDGILPYLREPVEEVFEAVVQHKGLPTRQDFRDLRNRVDMLDYHTKEATRTLHELRSRLKSALEGLAAEEGE